ncbi:hypothetical protein HII31_13199 [Pseudocercospora fuligena]|uniref:Uncharacterized protein n=1 Tax=Pseudocercospora fuligena TaxID=685502 RepID=A0A8H6VFX0_9PEZI|nr:hypothetical protein HII31_13199 [Pseudocercospora fuligena]
MSSTADLDLFTRRYLESFGFREGYNCIWRPQNNAGACGRRNSRRNLNGRNIAMNRFCWDTIKKQCTQIYHTARSGNDTLTVQNIHALARLLACGMHMRTKLGSHTDMIMEAHVRHDLLPLVKAIHRDILQQQITPTTNGSQPVDQAAGQALDQNLDNSLREGLQQYLSSDNEQLIDAPSTGDLNMVLPQTRAYSNSAGSPDDSVLESSPFNACSESPKVSASSPDGLGFGLDPSNAQSQSSSNDTTPNSTSIALDTQSQPPKVFASSPNGLGCELDPSNAQSQSSNDDTTPSSTSIPLDPQSQPVKVSDFDMVCSICGTAIGNVMHNATICNTGKPILRKDVCDVMACFFFEHNEWLHASTCVLGQVLESSAETMVEPMHALEERTMGEAEAEKQPGHDKESDVNMDMENASNHPDASSPRNHSTE